MAKTRDFGFKSQHSQLIAARAHTAPTAPKATSPDLALVPKLEPATVKVRKPTPVTNAGAVTNAARQARWRSKQDAVALRGQARERMKVLRSRRKPEKAVGS